MDIMKLHEKIRNLEQQIGNETIPKTETDAANQPIHSAQSASNLESIPYNRDVKHMNVHSLTCSRNDGQLPDGQMTSMVIQTNPT